MKTLSLTLVVSALLVSSAFAQAPPNTCGTVPACGANKKSPVTFDICSDQKDETGQPGDAITSIQLFNNGAALGAAIANPTPSVANAAGQVTFRVTVPVVKGAVNITATLTSAGGTSDPSDVCTFSVTAGKPSKPLALRTQ